MDEQHIQAAQNQSSHQSQDHAPVDISVDGNADIVQSVIVDGGSVGTIIGQQYNYYGAEPASRSDRNRAQMLANVHRIWIQGLLANSLVSEAHLHLGLREQQDAISLPLIMQVQELDRSPRNLPVGKPIIEIFNEVGGALLILGEAGAGKTTLLVELARALIDNANRDSAHPIPVVFNLSSWTERSSQLDDWLVDELNTIYSIPRKVGRAWMQEDAILPLLDGLDEVLEKRQQPCVNTINTFRSKHNMPIVVCCRTNAYELLTTKLRLNSAVVVLPLSSAQIDDYLAQGGPQVAELRTALGDEALRELIVSPLILNIMILTYRDAANTIPQISTAPVTWREQLFTAYIEQMFRRRTKTNRYTQHQTLLWLGWLGTQMLHQHLTVFAIEGIQPAWLLSRRQQWFYTICTGLLGGILLTLCSSLNGGIFSGLLLSLFAILDRSLFGSLRDGVANGILGGLLGGISGGVGSGLVITIGHLNPFSTWFQRSALMRRLVAGGSSALAVALVTGLVVLSISHNLAAALIIGLSTGFGAGLLATLLAPQRQITPAEAFTWSLQQMHRGLAYGLPLGIVFGLALGLSINQWRGGLIFGLLGGLVTGLGAGLQGNMVPKKRRPNEGIWRSATRAALAWLFGGIIFGLISGASIALIGEYSQSLRFGCFFGSFAGVLFGLYFGGLAFIQHYALRLVLVLSGSLPWRYVLFLDYAAERILLRKVGGSYIFVHRLLLEHFATIYGGLSDQK